MNENIKNIKETLTAMMDKAEDTELISNITKITTSLDAVETETKAADDRYRALLGNYKEVIKHTSFKPTNGANDQTQGTGLPQKKSLDDIIANAITAVKNNKN